MKVLFVWPGLTGYMGDCWRELAKRDGVELKVAVDLSETHFGGGFKVEEVLYSLDWSQELSSEWIPDTVFTVGWHNKLCRQAALKYSKLKAQNSKLKLICCFDMPWEWRLRKIAARFVLGRYLRRFDAAFVSGVSAARYARWLGFAESDVFKGLFATNTRRFDGQHKGGGGFLYVGREVQEKGIDVLQAAHERYRAQGGKWPLKIVNGVSPDELGSVYSKADCFVLASRWEPWGVVLVEAAAAGLPIICTDKCGARHEVVKGNGLVVKAGDADAMAEAMLKVERGEADIHPELGKELTKPYSCEAWADRVVDICRRIVIQGV